MFNRVLNRKDLQIFMQEVEEKNYPSNFPHIDLWGKDDAMLKWLSVLNDVRSFGEKKLKVVDLGSGAGCTPHIISSWGHDVTAIDISTINHLCTNSLVKMVLNDALIELKEMEDSQSMFSSMFVQLLILMISILILLVILVGNKLLIRSIEFLKRMENLLFQQM